jgi:MerR family transcriptional regulator, copper efflux regulator
MHLPLHEIKRKLQIKESNASLEKTEIEKQMETVTIQMKQLKNDLSDLLPILHQYKKDPMSKKFNEEGAALIKSLLKITS